MKLTTLAIAYITGRKNCRFDWLLDSLARQNTKRISQIIIVDYFAERGDSWTEADVIKRHLALNSHVSRVRLNGWTNINVLHVPPKPNIWGGPHRIMKEVWWHASAARNTALAYCKSDWITFLDDRCVIADGFMPGVKRAIQRGYAMFGAYEKRHGMVVRDGVIVEPGVVVGKDNREEIARGKILKVQGNWCYGCSITLPTAWAIRVNGFSEDYCDGCSMEDIIFGLCLANSGFKMCYDPTAKMIEDRTPSECTEKYRREDKGVSPNDKSHKLLEVFASAKESMNSYDIWDAKAEAAIGRPFPPPSASHIDWYDGKPHTNWDL